MVEHKNLWVFGDSYSYRWELPAPHRESGQHDYTKYFLDKYDRTPTHFSDVLNNEFHFSEVFNLSDRGSDNYSILEKIGNYIVDIEPNDYVVIGWSEVTRYRVVWKKQNANFWYRLFPNTPDNEWIEINKSHPIHTIHRDSYLTYKEIKHWQNILLKALPKNVLFWTPFWNDSMRKLNVPYLNVNELRISGKLTTIKEQTNGEQLDSHFSSEGMESIGEWMIDKFKNNVYRNGRII